ncbi:Scarecrow-like transcription factor [Melia azedarach]|uniref:Scarecrow-like transcription factor n=2 Tax=Melia azedarach TaxID=155640 RepID=A0ACC1WYU3_MELAZ|nr:Scarecrow-like transcription factor [Melia azedarach]KAJ4704066.1 Scarecrow-like transcription factor [Melia azedarach]
MQKSQKHQGAAKIHRMYRQPVQGIEPYCSSHIQILDNNMCSDVGSQGTSVSFQTYKEQFYTLESSSATTGFTYDSPSAVSISSNRSPFSPQGSQSCLSDPHHSPDNAYGSPMSGSSVVDDGSELRNKLRELEISLLGPESDIIDSGSCCFKSGMHQETSVSWNWDQLMEMIPRLDLKQVLIFCAQAVSDGDTSTAAGLMHALEQMVSVSGDPMQRLGAYMLEGLRARLEFSGSKIYKALKCEQPTSSELMSYMHILYLICPYWKFAYMSANVVIGEAVENERMIHIIDFQIAQGTQWVFLLQTLAKRPGGPPFVRITGIDDTQSIHARGGGLDIVGQKLSRVAASCNVPFEFHDAAMTGCEVQREHLSILPGEAVVVNFPYVLHHMPDESVSTVNHRDRLLRLVKSLSPKVVTLVEQESKTNTSPFFHRFLETLDYYTAMFECIDVACPRDDKKRISAEQHCVARDIVNMIACEGAERVERHELLGKWRSRFMMAGFTPYQLSPAVTNAVYDVLKEYNSNYRVAEHDGALYLGWRNRAMATSSAWR